MTGVRVITDRDEWNALVIALPFPDVRQSWQWGAIRAKRGWRAVRLAAFADGECVGALAVLSRTWPWLGTIAYAPRGPALAIDDERAWVALPQLLEAAAAVTGSAFVRLSPGLSDQRFDVASRLRASGLVGLPDYWTLWNTPRNVMRLSLEGSEQDLLSRMARKRRQHISTASRKGLSATRVDGPAARDRFYAMLTDHGARHRYPVRDRAYFEALHAAFAPDDAFFLVEGRVNDEVVAWQLGVRFGPVAYALLAPSTPASRGTAIGDLVHWEGMRLAHDRGCRVIDYGSSGTRLPPAENDPNRGIYRFKVEIGCEPQLCLAYHDHVADPRRYRLARVLETAAASRARSWLDRMPARLRLSLARRAA
jgi:lipid II:glycine glycyltransferase (peptidoglycan interpeptide bridge formation enzyme)